LSKLKTLKDFENEPPATRQILLDKIKTEAIKWVKHTNIEERQLVLKEFFNIFEEDLA
jgi:hypothetical protein